jgi:hypothetical protein
LGKTDQALETGELPRRILSQSGISREAGIPKLFKIPQGVDLGFMDLGQEFLRIIGKLFGLPEGIKETDIIGGDQVEMLPPGNIIFKEVR